MFHRFPCGWLSEISGQKCVDRKTECFENQSTMVAFSLCLMFVRFATLFASSRLRWVDAEVGLEFLAEIGGIGESDGVGDLVDRGRLVAL